MTATWLHCLKGHREKWSSDFEAIRSILIDFVVSPIRGKCFESVWHSSTRVKYGLNRINTRMWQDAKVVSLRVHLRVGSCVKMVLLDVQETMEMT